MTYDDVSKALDDAARANLSAADVAHYERYKARLIAEEIPPVEVEEILRGFIWDTSETSEE